MAYQYGGKPKDPNQQQRPQLWDNQVGQQDLGAAPAQGTQTPRPGSPVGGSRVSISRAPGTSQPQQGVNQGQGPQTAGGTSASGVQGSRFVNFGDWFNLNKDKAQGVAGKLAAPVQQQAEAVRQATRNAQNQFNQATANANPNLNYTPTPEKVEQAAGGAGVGVGIDEGPSIKQIQQSRQQQIEAMNGGAGFGESVEEPVMQTPTNAGVLGGYAMRLGAPAPTGTMTPGKYDTLASRFNLQAPTEAKLDMPAGAIPTNAFGDKTRIATTPDAFNGGITNEDQYNAAMGMKYAGPKSIEDMQNAAKAGSYADNLKAAQAADQRVGLLGSTGGIQQLLGEQYGNEGGYSPAVGAPSTGKSRLDAAMSGLGGAEQYADIQNRYKGLGDSLSSANAGSVGQAEAGAKSLADKQAGLKGAWDLLNKGTAPSQSWIDTQARQRGQEDLDMVRRNAQAAGALSSDWAGQSQIDLLPEYNNVDKARSAAATGSLTDGTADGRGLFTYYNQRQAELERQQAEEAKKLLAKRQREDT